MGGSSKQQTVGYRYFVGMHLILCQGPIDNLLRIRVDEKIASDNISYGGSMNISAPNLFGGDSREGGISGTLDIEFGGPAQVQNSYLLSKLGAFVPAFRGVVGVVLQQFYLGINPYLKKWDFRLKRIHTRQNGIIQWYDEKSEIGTIVEEEVVGESTSFNYFILPYIVDTSTTEAVNAIVVPSGGFNSVGNAPFGRAGTGGSLHPVYPINTYWGYNTSLWLKKDIYSSGASVTIEGYVENGALFYLDDILVYSVNLDNTQSATASGIPYNHTFSVTPGFHTLKILVLDEYDPANPPPEVSDVQDNTYFYCKANVLQAGIGQGDMNPAHIIRECLTDPLWGMGYTDGDIDDDSFIYAADTLFNEGMGMSLLWSDETPLEDFIKLICKHINASIYVDRKTGKFVLKLIRNDYEIGSLIELDVSNIIKLEDLTKVAFGELVNSITVTYWDKITGKNSTITVQDIALVSMQGGVVGTSILYEGFTNSDIASKVAQRDLKALSTPLISCTIYANRTAEDLNIGSVFILNWPDYELNNLVMRVTTVAFGDGKTNRIRITCTQDVFYMPQLSFLAPTPVIWEDPNQDPTAALYRAIVEAPYYELVQRLGQTTTDQQSATNPDIGYMLASAAGPEGAINGRIIVDSGAGYVAGTDYPMDFCPVAFLTSDIGYNETSITVSGFVGSSNVTAGTHAQIDEELIKIVSIVGNVITIGRGVLDTIPAKHLADSTILFWDAFADSDNVEYVAGETINVKLLPSTGNGTLEIALAPEDSLEFVSRAIRPYAPGNLKINTLLYSEAVSGIADFSVTWSYRDRVQQTAGNIFDTTYGNIGPEAGTLYTLTLKDEDGATLHTESSLFNSYTLTNANELLAFVKYCAPETGIFSASEVAIVPTSSLMVHYKCDTNAGNILVDSSGSSRNGSIYGSTLQSGVIDKALKFNGTSSDGALCSTYLNNKSGGFAISLWFNINFRHLTYDCVFIMDNNSGNKLRIFNYDNTQGLLFSWAGLNLNNVGGVRPSGNVHMIAQYNSTTGLTELYFNNVLIGSGNGTAGLATPNVTGLIGKAPSFYTSSLIAIDGWIDQFRFYNRTLTATERAALYTEPSATVLKYRLSSHLTLDLFSIRDGYESFQKHHLVVSRYGYGYGYGNFYGGK